MLSMLVITLLPRSKRLLVSWQQSQSAVILECKIRMFLTVSTVSLRICHGAMGPYAMLFVFSNVQFQASFFSLAIIKMPFSSSLLSAISVVSSAYLRLLIFVLALLSPA